MDKILQLPQPHVAIGTIEGELQILAKRKGFVEIEIRDKISGVLVHCYIPQDMIEDAKEAFNRRVAVRGRIQYKSGRIPESIKVEKIFRFPYERELPHHSQMRGILLKVKPPKSKKQKAN